MMHKGQRLTYYDFIETLHAEEDEVLLKTKGGNRLQMTLDELAERWAHFMLRGPDPAEVLERD